LPWCHCRLFEEQDNHSSYLHPRCSAHHGHHDHHVHHVLHGHDGHHDHHGHWHCQRNSPFSLFISILSKHMKFPEMFYIPHQSVILGL
jgi:hypothetical protein